MRRTSAAAALLLALVATASVVYCAQKGGNPPEAEEITHKVRGLPPLCASPACGWEGVWGQGWILPAGLHVRAGCAAGCAWCKHASPCKPASQVEVRLCAPCCAHAGWGCLRMHVL